MAVLLALVTLTLALAGCTVNEAKPPSRLTSTSTPTTTAPRPVSIVGSIVAFDQVSNGTRIVVHKAELHGLPGYIVVHAEEAEGPGRVVGHAAIPEGVSDDVVVTLDVPVPPGPYWVMLHRDGGTAGTFEWPGPDGPVRPPVGLTYATERIMVSSQ